MSVGPEATPRRPNVGRKSFIGRLPTTVAIVAAVVSTPEILPFTFLEDRRARRLSSWLFWSVLIAVAALLVILAVARSGSPR